MNEQQRAAILATLSDEEAALLNYAWSFWARPKQVAPETAWVIWLILAGRGFGKTRSGAEWIRHRVETGAAKRIILAGATADDARDIMIEGESGLLACSDPSFMPVYSSAKARVTWPNGAIALVLTADKPDRFRGKQCFVAGTLVETDRGPKPIELVGVGDMVLTRNGHRRVKATTSSKAVVGSVGFSNGVRLVGTHDHPVWSEGSWWELGCLCTGSKTWCGELAPMVTSSATQTENNTSNIALSGKARSAQSRPVGTSTTRTAIGQTTRLRTSNACHHGRTTIGTWRPERFSTLPARCAGTVSSEGAQVSHPSALHANKSGQIMHGSANERARIAAENSCLAVGSTVASVVSTWARVGVRQVFNLTVDGSPEYFANGILVHNCDTFWADELAAWRYPDAWTQMQLGFRLGNDPRGIVTTTPRPIPIVKDLVRRDDVAVTRGTTYENRANLSPVFLEQVVRQYEGTRLGRQELNAEILDDNPGALWKRSQIESLRVAGHPDLVRIVVAVDPAVSANEDSDLTGIVVAGVGKDGQGYVLDDVSGIYTPLEWGRKVIETYHAWKADRVIAEVNQGGDLVEANLKGLDAGLPFTAVHATRGKQVRAEPIAALYEQGRVHHVGMLAKLEDQMCDWDPALSKKSPDRMDALVWALSSLMLKSSAFKAQTKPDIKPRVSIFGDSGGW